MTSSIEKTRIHVFHVTLNFTHETRSIRFLSVRNEDNLVPIKGLLSTSHTCTRNIGKIVNDLLILRDVNELNFKIKV